MEDAIAVRRVPLDLTYVTYHESSTTSIVLALLTLSPILINPAYAVLVVQTRELFFLEMWAGQMLCEAFNWGLKHIIKEKRPNFELGDGYGFPSSHSQWMGYFAAFLLCHIAFRHRFVSTGYRLLDLAWRSLVQLFIVGWAGAVAYSRYHLSYHSAHQVLWGVLIGAFFGTSYYAVIELIPCKYPASTLGQVRAAVLSNPISSWFRLRDGWAVWGDSGTEDQWQRWRSEWNRRRLQIQKDIKRE